MALLQLGMNSMSSNKLDHVDGEAVSRLKQSLAATLQAVGVPLVRDDNNNDSIFSNSNSDSNTGGATGTLITQDQAWVRATIANQLVNLRQAQSNDLKKGSPFYRCTTFALSSVFVMLSLLSLVVGEVAARRAKSQAKQGIKTVQGPVDQTLGLVGNLGWGVLWVSLALALASVPVCRNPDDY
eukprot:c12076_g2_i1.p1 GENE.c12076_g2_i1~~c12076_g2_i1.p1  ORF type:complete len:183 (-),score=66.44 c12076_g2_i1:156-704(-)